MSNTSALATRDSVLALSQVLGPEVPGDPGDPNLSFEESNGAGLPSAWLVTTVETARAIAPFGWPLTEAGSRGEETFEAGWIGTYLTTWPTSGQRIALFSGAVFSQPLTAEGFEGGWGNTPYFTTSAVLLEALWDSETLDADGFEAGWDQDLFVLDPDTGILVQTRLIPIHVALWGGTLQAESFETGWGVTNFVNDWVEVIPTVAKWAGERLHTAEDYEDVLAAQPCTVASGTATAAELALDPGFRVSFQAPEGGALPTGWSAGILYYMVNFIDGGTSVTFQVSLSFAGTAVTTSDGGTGPITFTCPGEFWNTLMATI